MLWWRYLVAHGYECRVYGDPTSPYPRLDGLATAGNVRTAVREMVHTAQSPDDHIVFVSSGHGSGDGQGNSYLCVLCDDTAADPHARDGQYWDHELAQDLAGARATLFVHLDHCLSGGMIEEILQAVPRVFGTTTSNEVGFGYDDTKYDLGAWTHRFASQGLMQKKHGVPNDLVTVFESARTEYKQRYAARHDQPCLFARDGNTEADKWDSRYTALPPLGRFLRTGFLPIA